MTIAHQCLSLVSIVLLTGACAEDVKRPRPEGADSQMHGLDDRTNDFIPSCLDCGDLRNDGATKLDMKPKVLDGQSRSEATAVHDKAPPTESAPTGSGYLIMPATKLKSLPATGSPWNFMKLKADEAVATTLNASSSSSPWLPNYTIVAPKYLAAALVYASSWTGNKAPYRQAVENALRHVVGSEASPSSDGTASSDALLATCRQLSAWVMAADLIGFNGSLTGSRSGWTGVTFDAWLKGILAKTIGTHGRWTTITITHENSASNWGAHCAASRIAVARYLKNTVELARAATIVRGVLGDTSAYPTYPPGTKPAAGSGFEVTSSFDSTWACPYSATVGGWKPINPSSCGQSYDGIPVEDLSRSAGSYPNFDSTGISYGYEFLGAHHLAAILLDNAGYPAFTWSSDALKRGMLWLQRVGQLPSTSNYSVERHVPWVTNHYYGIALPTQPAVMGRSLGFTDWLFP